MPATMRWNTMSRGRPSCQNAAAAAMPNANATGNPMTTQRANMPISNASPMLLYSPITSLRMSLPIMTWIRWPTENRKTKAPHIVKGSDRSPSGTWISGIKLFHLNLVNSKPFQNIKTPKPPISTSVRTTKAVRRNLGAFVRNKTTAKCVSCCTPTAAPKKAITIISRCDTCSTQVGVSFNTYRPKTNHANITVIATSAVPAMIRQILHIKL